MADSMAPPVIFKAPGGYPRTYTYGTDLLLATSIRSGDSPIARCGLFASRDVRTWRPLAGPQWTVSPSTDLSNCAPGVASDGTTLIGVRHHDGAEAIDTEGASARPQRWSANNSTFRIQVVRAMPNGTGWDSPTTVYSTHDRQHAAWEPVFFRSLDGRRIRITYSLERPASWSPPACAPGTNFPGGDLAQPSRAGSAAACQGRCTGVAACAAWSWRRTDGQCWLKTPSHGKAADPKLTSGAKLCGAGLGVAAHAAASANSGDGADSGDSSGGGDGATADVRREQDVVMQESADDGRSWGPVRVVTRTPGSRDGMPSVSRLRDGCLFLVHEGFGGRAWDHFGVSAARSCDDGTTWIKQPVFPRQSAGSAHAPTIALLPSGRAAVASYDEANQAQMQLSAWPLNGTTAASWSAPAVVVPAPAAWPNVFADARARQLWIAYGRAGLTYVAGPVEVSVPRRS